MSGEGEKQPTMGAGGDCELALSLGVVQADGGRAVRPELVIARALVAEYGFQAQRGDRTCTAHKWKRVGQPRAG